jgi:hypothetical protein
MNNLEAVAGKMRFCADNMCRLPPSDPVALLHADELRAWAQTIDAWLEDTQAAWLEDGAQ